MLTAFPSLPSLHNLNEVLLVGQHAELSDRLKDMFTLKYHISLEAKRGAQGHTLGSVPTRNPQPAVVCSEELLSAQSCLQSNGHLQV